VSSIQRRLAGVTGGPGRSTLLSIDVILQLLLAPTCCQH